MLSFSGCPIFAAYEVLHDRGESSEQTEGQSTNTSSTNQSTDGGYEAQCVDHCRTTYNCTFRGRPGKCCTRCGTICRYTDEK